MKAIEFKEQNVIIAKDQKEYLPLPAHVQPNGLVTFCIELDDDQAKKGKLMISFLTFGRPMQPVSVSIYKPDFPVSHLTPMKVIPSMWIVDKSEAVCDYMNGSHKKHLWITVATFGAPLQPIKIF